MEVKEGLKSTELWAGGLAGFLLTTNEQFAQLSVEGQWMLAGLSALYMICRTAVKIFASRPAPIIFEPKGSDDG